MPGAGSVAQPIAEAGVANDLSRNAQRGQADLPVPLEALPSGALPPLRAVFPEGLSERPEAAFGRSARKICRPQEPSGDRGVHLEQQEEKNREHTRH